MFDFDSEISYSNENITQGSNIIAYNEYLAVTSRDEEGMLSIDVYKNEEYVAGIQIEDQSTGEFIWLGSESEAQSSLMVALTHRKDLNYI